MKELVKWIALTNDIVEIFLIEYFELLDEEDPYFYWIGDEVGGVFEFADYFIGFNSILECYKHKVSKEDFFNWYDSTLQQQTHLSLADFIISPAKREEARVKYLAELKERVKWAKKELEKALEEYDTKS